MASVRSPAKKQERNAACACGSGKKYKKCHYLIDHEKSKKVAAEAQEMSKKNTEPESQVRSEERARRLREFGRLPDGRPLPYGQLLPLLDPTAPKR